MSTEISPELQSTVDMICCAFPDKIDSWAYLPLLLVLYEHMSDRNLALVVSSVSAIPYERVLNDVYKVGGDPECCQADAVAQVLERLQNCGFERWVSESL
jgi:hypothetical protein